MMNSCVQGHHSVSGGRSCFVLMKQEQFLTGFEPSTVLLWNVRLIFGFAWEQSCKCSPTRSGCSHEITAGFAPTRAAQMEHKCVIVIVVGQWKVIGGAKVDFGVTAESFEWCSAR